MRISSNECENTVNFKKIMQKEIAHFVKKLHKKSQILLNNGQKNFANFGKRSQRQIENFINWLGKISRIFPISHATLSRILTNKS